MLSALFCQMPTNPTVAKVMVDTRHPLQIAFVVCQIPHFGPPQIQSPPPLDAWHSQHLTRFSLSPPPQFRHSQLSVPFVQSPTQPHSNAAQSYNQQPMFSKQFPYSLTPQAPPPPLGSQYQSFGGRSAPASSVKSFTHSDPEAGSTGGKVPPLRSIVSDPVPSAAFAFSGAGSGVRRMSVPPTAALSTSIASTVSGECVNEKEVLRRRFIPAFIVLSPQQFLEAVAPQFIGTEKKDTSVKCNPTSNRSLPTLTVRCRCEQEGRTTPDPHH